MNSIIGAINSTQQAIVAVGPRVVNPYIAGLILTISTAVAGVIAFSFGVKAMFECRLDDCLERKIIVQIPLVLFVGGVNFAVSKLLNFPFPLHISIPLTMAIYFLVANILEEVVLDASIPYADPDASGRLHLIGFQEE